MGNQQNIVFFSFLGESDNVFTLFVESSKIKLNRVISPSYSSPSPIKAFEISTMYWSFCMLAFSFNLILRRGCERKNRNRLWLLEFQIAAPLNLPEKWQWSLIFIVFIKEFFLTSDMFWRSRNSWYLHLS